MIQLDSAEIFIYGSLWTAVWGGIVWFSKDRIYDKREKKKRRREFRAWLAQLKSRVDKSGRVHVIGDEWDDTRHVFVSKADEVADAIPRRKRPAFNAAVHEVGNMSPGEVDDIKRDDRQELILAGVNRLSERLGEVIKFL